MAGKKPCFAFQTGNCKYGLKCKFSHDKEASIPKSKTKACEFFAKGKCLHGKKCKWSHDTDDIAAFKTRLADPECAREEQEKKTTEAAFKKWRYCIPEETRNVKKLGAGMGDFVQQAYVLVSGETGVMQEVINLLASDGGMTRIAELLDFEFDGVSDAQLGRIFDDRLLPFFKILTGPNVSASPILENRIMTICSFIYGFGGQRAVQVFQAATRHLSTLTLVSAGDEVNSDTVAAFEHSISTLSLVVKVNTPAQTHEGLVPIVETLSALLESPSSDAVVFALRNTTKHLNNLQQRFGLGKAIPTNNGKKQTHGQTPTFELAKDLPGILSNDGARHDNDSDDIRQISILPTLQEIQSSRNEYLPSADPRDWHIGGLEGVLDRNFRLLREDTVGQLRDVAKFELERLQNPRRHADHQRRRQGVRTNVYENVELVDIAFDPKAGLQFAFGFDQPQHLHDKGHKQREEWWEVSKRLGSEGLICLLSSDGTAIFFTVAQEPLDVGSKDAELERVRGRLHKTYTLHKVRDRAYAIAQLVKKEDVPLFVRRVIGNKKATLSIVEFPGVLLPAFMPTLQSMQNMSESLDLPFADIIAPTSTPDNPERDVQVPLPAYATRPNFTFDLSSLANEANAGATIRLTPGKKVDDTIQALQAHTSLDAGQAEALASSLSRSLALIQGPPGTGKSHTGLQIIRSLLANKAKINLGPILCVTYTNHALDQVLERSLDRGITQIVRIGGRSKSERLAELNLRFVAKNEELTKTEKSDRWRLKKKIDAEAKEINHILGEFERLGRESQLKPWLQGNYRQHHDQLFQYQDEEGWQEVNYHKGSIIDRWLREGMRVPGELRTVDELKRVHVDSMSKQERERLYGSWIAEIKHEVLNKLRVALRDYHAATAELDLIRTEVDLRVLRQASIIGVTTSGLARNIDLLRRTNAKVLMSEEAGEVLEAHLLTALLPSVEHAILIGDHRQLRPSVQNYDLSSESRNGGQYSLDISLFERLVQPNDILARPLPFSTLGVQRRMHPSISELVRSTIYPHLVDAPSVNDYPQVSGLKHRLFWLDHQVPENEGGEAQATSRTNDYEVEMTARLVSHLVKQGVYSAGDIAVITPYLGQLRKIRNKLSQSFEVLLNERDQDELAKDGDEDVADVQTGQLIPKSQVARGTLLSALRVATVDAYQGEEAKVIVVSLVRSNDTNSPGFLKTSNRINVLLSRAQHGMYLIGNSQTMQTVKMWADVIGIFKANDRIGTSLELCCPRHPEAPLFVNVPEDFTLVAPEAGCSLTCNARLPCGHRCFSKCHSQLLHDASFCIEPCTRPQKGCTEHACPRRCGDQCPAECMEPVEGIKVTPIGCDHIKTSLPCYQARDPSKILCEEEVTRTVDSCGHEVKVPCYEEVNGPTFRCEATCNAPLQCGHTCRKKCFKCRKLSLDNTVEIDHGRCNQRCERNYTTCSHTDQTPCHGAEDCPPCKAKCEVSCSHSACDRPCSESCVPCAEPSCSTEGCTMPCAAPCNSLPSIIRSEEMLPCGHQSPAVAGEKCPDVAFCQVCGSDENLDQTVDYIMFAQYRDINLEEDPCVFPACGHIFTISSLDGTMGMKKFYEIDQATGEFIKIKKTVEPFSSDELKTCPECRGSLRDVSRYGRTVRRAMLDESVKKLVVWANRQYFELNARVVAEHERLLKDLETFRKPNQHVAIQGKSANQINMVKSLHTSSRYRTTLTLLGHIQKFVKKLRQEEQPYQRIQDLVETARRKNRAAGIEKFDFDSSELQLREHHQATSLLLRCEIVLFADVINAHHKTPPSDFKGALIVDFADNRARCEALVNDAREAKSVLQEAEGHVFWARFAALEIGALDVEMTPQGLHAGDELKQAGMQHLEEAEAVCAKLGATTADLQEEIMEVRRMLENGTSESEMRMVVAAMAKEFSGTGHWYRCANGHPFTVGECGMPMQRAICPACRAPVGGQSHRPAEGVQHAGDIERDFGGMNLDD